MARKSKEARRERRRTQPGERREERPARAENAWVASALTVAFLLSGAAGLIHEVVWTRLLGHVFGVTSLAVSTVLAAFMGGLALGSWWIGSRSARLTDQRRTYALLEVGIGLCAFAVPLVLDLVEPVYGWVWRNFHLSFTAFSVLRFLIAGSILLVPTIMMGATLPVLADYLAGFGRQRVAPEWLYTMNLVGAVFGVAMGGFVLMPYLGVWGTITVGAALNIGVGAVVLGMPEARNEAAPSAQAVATGDPEPIRLLLFAAFCSGLASLATQVAWTRVLALIVGSTTYAFSSVLLVYLLALGAGSAWASYRGARITHVGPDLAVMHLAMALFMVAAVFAVNKLPVWYSALYDIWGPEALSGSVARGLVTAFGVLILPVLSAGTILPLVLVGAVPRREHAGPAVGRIYAVNTLGAIAGAILAGFLFVPVFGTQWTLLGIAASGAALGIAFAFTRPRPEWLPAAALGVTTLIALGIALRPTWNYQQLHSGVFEPARRLTEDQTAPLLTLYHREGPTASVLVEETPDHDMRVLRINARTNASDHPGDMATQVMVGQLPLVLAPHPDDVFVIGWGSGVTVGATTQSPAKHITAVELEPAVVEASQFFNHVNHEPLHDPRLRLFEDDARHILFASDDTYDVIVSEPPHPWVAGVANLFTQDFYRLVDRRLRPDGVFAQWVQTYEIEFDTYRSILASVQSVFPEVMVFASPGTTDTILIASRQPLLFDLEALGARWAYEPMGAELTRIGLARPEYLLASMYLAPAKVRQLVQGARLNTDDNMLVEFSSAHGMIGEEQQIMPAIDHNASESETVLPDPSVLVEDRERLTALIEGLKLMERDTKRYDALLAALP
jgi:spermidine synthase